MHRAALSLCFLALCFDGSRFLVSVPAEKSEESRIRVILNWTSLLSGKG